MAAAINRTKFNSPISRARTNKIAANYGSTQFVEPVSYNNLWAGFAAQHVLASARGPILAKDRKDIARRRVRSEQATPEFLPGIVHDLVSVVPADVQALRDYMRRESIEVAVDQHEPLAGS